MPEERQPIPYLPDEDGQIREIQAGHAAAFEALFRTQYESLVGYAATLLGATEPARDVVCEVFATIWKERTSWQPAHGVRAYLFRAVRNRCRNISRDEQRRADLWARQHPDDLPLPGRLNIDADRELDQDAQWDVVRQAIHTMPPLRREAARLRWVEQLEYVEIATIMEISVNAVQQHLSLALKMLRARFGGQTDA